MDDLLRDFLTEANEHLDTVDAELVRFEQNPSDEAILRNIFRLVHTIKGTCGFLGLPRLEAVAHAGETLMGRLRDGMPATPEAVTLILLGLDRIKMILATLDRTGAEPEGSDRDIIAALDLAATVGFGAAPRLDRDPAPALDDAAPIGVAEQSEPATVRHQTIRVAVDTLERLMTTVSELVLTRNQLLDAARRSGDRDDLKAPLQRLSQVTAELQDGIMKTRMQPIGSAWAKLPRLARDLGAELGKRIEIVTRGAETELDRQVLEQVRDPLIHMIRNSADHGIEPPDERIRLGKPPHGTITLTAAHEGGSITIEIADDGRGLDHAAIRRRAQAVGLAGEAELARMSEDQVATLIFQPGFSTATEISAVSGRGVGMDVVRSNLAEIGGTVEIVSQAGRGSRFGIKIPLTLAIVAALILEAGGRRFALPQTSIVELVRVGGGSQYGLQRIHGAAVLRIRDELVPVLDLGDVLGLPTAGRTGAADDGIVVVAQVGRQRFGMLVATVLETEEIVVKPMSPRLRHIPVYAGTTILGDGTVVLIVDPNGVARRIGKDLGQAIAEAAGAARPAREADETTTLLVFKGADQAFKAVPLSMVTRIEEVDAAAIEQAGGQACLQYRGRLMPVRPIDGFALRRSGTQALIVIGEGNRQSALAVSEIVDIVDAVLAVEPVPGRPDLVGSAIVGGRATEIVDLAPYWPDGPGRAAPAQDGERPTILLAEPSAFFRDMLGPVLKAAGYRVRLAPDQARALELAEQGGIDAIVADLDLPGRLPSSAESRGGLALVEEMRRRPALRGITVLLLAADAEPAVLGRARALGVFDVVAKFDRSGLVAALAEAANGASLELAA